MAAHRVLITVVSVLVSSTSLAQSTTVNIRDSSGRVIGSEVTTYPTDPRNTDPRTTNIRDSSGQVTGSTVTYSDGTTVYRDSSGRITGTKEDPNAKR